MNPEQIAIAQLQNENARLWRVIEMIIDHLESEALDDAFWRIHPTFEPEEEEETP